MGHTISGYIRHPLRKTTQVMQIFSLLIREVRHIQVKVNSGLSLCVSDQQRVIKVVVVLVIDALIYCLVPFGGTQTSEIKVFLITHFVFHVILDLEIIFFVGWELIQKALPRAYVSGRSVGLLFPIHRNCILKLYIMYKLWC